MGRLLDDLVRLVPLDDVLDLRDLVARPGQEARRVAADDVVGGRLDLDVLDAAVEAAFADERPLTRVVGHRGRVLDPLVCVAEVVLPQRARCIVIDHGSGVYAVFFAHDLPVRLARAELQSYLHIWERTTPGGRVAILDDDT